MLEKNYEKIIRLYTEGTDWLTKNDAGHVILRRKNGSTLTFESVEAYNADKPRGLAEWPEWVEDGAILEAGEDGRWFPRSFENDVVRLAAAYMRQWVWEPRYVIL